MEKGIGDVEVVIGHHEIAPDLLEKRYQLWGERDFVGFQDAFFVFLQHSQDENGLVGGGYAVFDVGAEAGEHGAS